MPQSYSWTLATPASAAAAQTTTAAATVSKRPRFQPRGLLVPLRRDEKNDFANGTGEELAISKVTQVLGTSPGELDWNPSFGCPLHRARHKNNTPMLQAMLRVLIADAFMRWLPSYELRGVTFKAAERTLTIAVYFNERAANGPVFEEDLTASIPLPVAT